MKVREGKPNGDWSLQILTVTVSYDSVFQNCVFTACKRKKTKGVQMREIICPHCSKAFTVDEAGYAAIVQQVRTKEFEDEIHARLEAFERRKDAEFSSIRAEADLVKQKAIADKDSEIERLKSQIEGNRSEIELAVQKAVKERDTRIAELETKMSAHETEKQLAVTQALEKKNLELAEASAKITGLKGEMKAADARHELELQNREALYREQTRLHQEEVERLKDFKLSLSTKAIGESLEVYCHNEFDKIRAMAFPNCYFEKDNDASSGSKGDFIFRDYAPDGTTELISILFEMKNEMDDTEHKHKNEDFFKKLDKDRTEKKCEYAVLVTMLEADNELYNAGIVDVSHRYQKMYVCRPQFFIPVLSFLTNAAQKSAQYRQELELMKAQNIDISNFEDNLNSFKSDFDRNYGLAKKKFIDAIDQIDDTIKKLQKIKENLLSSENNLRIANEKAEKLTVKKLTRNNPTVQRMFQIAAAAQQAD